MPVLPLHFIGAVLWVLMHCFPSRSDLLATCVYRSPLVCSVILWHSAALQSLQPREE